MPRFYLRGFANDEALWAYDKRTGTRFATKVKSIANETAMYSEELEAHLANEVEDPAKPAISKLRLRQTITSEDRLALAKYIVALWKRVPVARDRAMGHLPKVADELSIELYSGLDLLAEHRPDLLDSINKRREEIAAAITNQRLNPSPELWYHSIKFQSSTEVVDSLLSMNWVFLCCESHQLLTGDNPVFFFEHEGIGKPTSEVTWPLSSTLALWATRLARPSMHYLQATALGVREINRRTAHNSSRFVYAKDDAPWILPFITKKQWRLTRLQ